MPVRKCPKCGMEHPLTPEFWYPRTEYGSGFRSPCKACRNEVRATQRRARKLSTWEPRRAKGLEERFWEKVDKSGDCWLWTKSLRAGYGVFRKSGRLVSAHRLAYEITNGPIPADLCICHHCDNRQCVNPSHMFLGTHKDNMQDAMGKGRFHFNPKPSYGEKNGMTKLTDDQVRELRNNWPSSESVASIAMRYGVSRWTIQRIVRRKVWKHVE